MTFILFTTFSSNFPFYINSFLFLWPLPSVLCGSSSSVPSLNIGICQHFILSSLFLSPHKGNFTLFLCHCLHSVADKFQLFFQLEPSVEVLRKAFCFYVVISTCCPTTEFALLCQFYSSGIFPVTLALTRVAPLCLTPHIHLIYHQLLLNIPLKNFSMGSVVIITHQFMSSLTSAVTSFSLLWVLFFTHQFPLCQKSFSPLCMKGLWSPTR